MLVHILPLLTHIHLQHIPLALLSTHFACLLEKGGNGAVTQCFLPFLETTLSVLRYISDKCLSQKIAKIKQEQEQLLDFGGLIKGRSSFSLPPPPLFFLSLILPNP